MLHIVTSVTYSKNLLPTETHYMPGRNLSALRSLSHLILTSSLGDWHYYKPHFTDDKTETWKY